MLDSHDEEITAGIGHNNPPNDQAVVTEKLDEKTSELRQRHDSLLAAIQRMPTSVEDDEMAGKFADMIKQISACSKSLEGMRVAEKEPYMTLSRVVDGYFKKFTDSLDTAKRTATRPLEAYLRRKEEARREAEREAARVAREESARLQREAAELERANMPDLANRTISDAVRADEVAAEAEKLSEAKPADLARTRGDYGSLATLRTVWVGEIVDRNALPKDTLWPFLSLDVIQKAVNAYVKAGGRDLAGAKIYEQSNAQVR